jgi:hypothetical protein
MKICAGQGQCLTQCGKDLKDMKDPEIECSFHCLPIKCQNYILCKGQFPQWMSHDHRLCSDCLVFYALRGAFKIVGQGDCPICLEATTCVRLMNCDHVICVDCFRRCYHIYYSFDDSDGSENDPQFPYSTPIEDEYWADQKNPKWVHDEKIQQWINDCNDSENQKDLKYEAEEYLRQCPLCRK